MLTEELLNDILDILELNIADNIELDRVSKLSLSGTIELAYDNAMVRDWLERTLRNMLQVIRIFHDDGSDPLVRRKISLRDSEKTEAVVLGTINARNRNAGIDVTRWSMIPESEVYNEERREVTVVIMIPQSQADLIAARGNRLRYGIPPFLVFRGGPRPVAANGARTIGRRRRNV